MKSRLAATFVAAAATAVSVLVAPAQAGQASAAGAGGTASSTASAAASGVVSSGSARHALAPGTQYWTPERMRAARPAPVPQVRRPLTARAPQTQAGTGRRVAIPGTAGQLGSSSATTSGAGSIQTLAAATAVPRPYTNLPDRTNGKVFFTDGVFDYECSATAVRADNKSLVWTAGHCVHGGPGVGFFRNWVFVPAYSSSRDGARPYGTWRAKEMFTLRGWAENQNPRQDLASVVMNRRDGVRLSVKIGAQGIGFNYNPEQRYSSFGYPAADPFNGYRQYRCNSDLLGRDNPPGTGPRTMKISCNMTEGSSGGGWLRGIRDGIGTVSSVNSYRYQGEPNRMYGPYQGDLALQLYNAARKRPV